MADAITRAQSSASSGVSRLDSVSGASSRAPISSNRPVSPVAGIQRDYSFAQQPALQTAVAQNTPKQSSVRQPDQRAGSGLLSNNIELALAETRSFEANATFIPQSSINQALNSYGDVQVKVQETIRDNLSQRVSMRLDSDSDEEGGASGASVRPRTNTSV